ncbi:MAG: hypothetical protein C4326_04400 [Ignavibacteria bacterium]
MRAGCQSQHSLYVSRSPCFTELQHRQKILRISEKCNLFNEHDITATLHRMLAWNEQMIRRSFMRARHT